MAGSFEEGYAVGFAAGKDEGWSEGFRLQMDAHSAFEKEISDELDEMYVLCGDLLLRAIQTWYSSRVSNTEQFKRALKRLDPDIEDKLNLDDLSPYERY